MKFERAAFSLPHLWSSPFVRCAAGDTGAALVLQVD